MTFDDELEEMLRLLRDAEDALRLAVEGVEAGHARRKKLIAELQQTVERVA